MAAAAAVMCLLVRYLQMRCANLQRCILWPAGGKRLHKWLEVCLRSDMSGHPLVPRSSTSLARAYTLRAYDRKAHESRGRITVSRKAICTISAHCSAALSCIALDERLMLRADEAVVANSCHVIGDSTLASYNASGHILFIVQTDRPLLSELGRRALTALAGGPATDEHARAGFLIEVQHN